MFRFHKIQKAWCFVSLIGVNALICELFLCLQIQQTHLFTCQGCNYQNWSMIPTVPTVPIPKAYVPKSKMKRTFVYADGVKVLHRITNKSLTEDGWADCDGVTVTVHCPTKWNPASEQMPRALNHDDKPVYTKQVLRGIHGCLCGTFCKARKMVA